MKKMIFTTLVLVIAISSCKKFLVTEPLDLTVTTNFYNNQDQMNQSLTAVYAAVIKGCYSRAMHTNFGVSDEFTYVYPWGSFANNIYLYNFDNSNPDITSFWGTLYTGINNANSLIANINKPKMDETARGRILAEATFLRGFAYYLLVTHFGDVPLLLSPTTDANNVNIPRAPSKDVYQSILKDMESSVPQLASIADLGYSSRITKTAAQGIIARVSLSMAGEPLKLTKYADTAMYYASQVINSGLHSLNVSRQGQDNDSSYAQIFINLAQNQFDIKESMFEADFSGTTTTYPIARTAGFVGFLMGIPSSGSVADGIGYCYAFVNATKTLYNLYAPGDLRRDFCIGPYFYTGGQAFPQTQLGILKVPRSTTGSTAFYDRQPAKFRREYETLWPKSKYDTPEDFPILRFADVLLMYAEAANMANGGPTQQAYDAINQVRRRAYSFNGNGGAVKQVSVTNAGTGYTPMGTVTFSGGGGSGAAAAVRFIAGEVAAITITNPGSGYTSEPTISISGANGMGSGAIVTTTITNGQVTGTRILYRGVGYSDVPVSFTGGGGSGAMIVATVVPAGQANAGTISALTLVHVGKGYTAPPAITIGGTGTGALASAQIVSQSDVEIPKGLSKDQFQAVIVDERARELCFEGLRWTDLRRWGLWNSKLTEVANLMISDGVNNNSTYSLGLTGINNARSSSKFLLFPIPASEISVNKGATQNPGY